MITIFGIKNCDTMKKAFRWLDENNIEYHFHDYKKAGVDEIMAKAWIDLLGWENIINKRGTTWRKLDDEVKSTIDSEKAVNLMLAQPSIIKRPLLQLEETKYLLGFNSEEYAKKLL